MIGQRKKKHPFRVEATTNARGYRIEYVDPKGERRQAYRPTSDEANALLAQAISEYGKPLDQPIGTTLSQFYPHWLAQVQDDLKPRTLESYESTWRLHIEPAFGDTPITGIRRGAIKDFLRRKLRDHARNSVRIMHATLRVILSGAIDAEIIQANPAAGLGKSSKKGNAVTLIDKPKVRQQRIKAFTREERDTFLATAREIQPCLAPLWEVAVLAGLRPGESYALREEDVDFKTKTLRVERTLSDDGASIGTCKTEGIGTVDLSARAVQVLRAHLIERKVQKLARGWEEMPEALFPSEAGTYLNPSDVRRAFRRVVRTATLPSVSPHGLRHTYASVALSEGVDMYYVSRMLRHASIKLTVDTYGNHLPASRPGALDGLDPVGTAMDGGAR